MRQLVKKSTFKALFVTEKLRLLKDTGVEARTPNIQISSGRSQASFESLVERSFLAAGGFLVNTAFANRPGNILKLQAAIDTTLASMVASGEISTTEAASLRRIYDVQQLIDFAQDFAFNPHAIAPLDTSK